MGAKPPIELVMAGAQYEIVVNGQLGKAFTRWFEKLEIRSASPDATCLRGWFPDQSALQGVLTELSDLGLELSSVRRLDSTPN
jgi:hypothetical protein